MLALLQAACAVLVKAVLIECVFVQVAAHGRLAQPLARELVARGVGRPVVGALGVERGDGRLPDLIELLGMVLVRVRVRGYG